MKIQYDLRMDDVVAFNQYHIKNSPTHKRTRMTTIIIAMVILMAIAIRDGFKEQSFESPVIMAIICTILLIWLPKLFKRRTEKYVKRLYSEGSSKGLLCSHEIEINDNGIIDRTGLGEQITKWEGIQKIVSTETHTFVYFDPVMAHVIPRISVTNGNCDAFLQELNNRFNQVVPSGSREEKKDDSI